MPIKKVNIKEWEELGLPKETNFINFGQHMNTLKKKKKNKISKKNSTPNNSKTKNI